MTTTKYTIIELIESSVGFKCPAAIVDHRTWDEFIQAQSVAYVQSMNIGWFDDIRAEYQVFEVGKAKILAEGFNKARELEVRQWRAKVYGEQALTEEETKYLTHWIVDVLPKYWNTTKK